MPLPQAQTKTPTEIGEVRVELTDYPDTPADTARFVVEILDQDGIVMGVKHGDLIPHLTPQQINALVNFMAMLRTQAESEILP